MALRASEPLTDRLDRPHTHIVVVAVDQLAKPAKPAKPNQTKPMAAAVAAKLHHRLPLISFRMLDWLCSSC